MAISSDNAYVQVNVRYRVEGLNEAKRGAEGAANAFGKLGKIFKQVGLSLLAYKAINQLKESIISAGKALVNSNAQFEKFEVQLKIFSGSGAKAADLMKFLTFQSTRLAGGLQDLLGGATALQTFGIDVKENLELVADVAQATNREVEDVAIAFGRIVAGDPRTKQFLVTRRGDLEAFNNALKEGKSRLEATRIAFQTFSGVSAELEGTWSRLTENLGDVLFVAAKIAGGPIFKELQAGLSGIVDILRSQVFDEEGKERVTGFFVGLGEALAAPVEALKTTAKALETIKDALEWFATFGGQKVAARHKVGADIADQLRAALGPEFTEGRTKAAGETGWWGVGATAESRAREAYARMVFGFFGLDEQGLSPADHKRIEREAIDRANQIERDMLREQEFESRRKAKERRLAADQARQSIHDAARMRLFGRGIDLGVKPDWKKDIVESMGLFTKNQRRAPFEEEGVPQFPELDPDVQEARMQVEIDLWNRKKELQWRIEDILKKGSEKNRKEYLKKQQEMFEEQYKMAERFSDRAVQDLGYIFFGGRGANAAIDKQVAALQKEIDVLDGVTTPLTRQEELMNRIVELEAQRVTLNERVGSIIRRTLGDLAEAAAKAALLRSFGFGTARRGQKGGFWGLLQAGLGFIPHPAAQVASAGLQVSGAGIQNAFGAGFDAPGGPPGVNVSFESNFPARKPVVVNNPIFLSNDVRNVAEKFAEEAGRRMR